MVRGHTKEQPVHLYKKNNVTSSPMAYCSVDDHSS